MTDREFALLIRQALLLIVDAIERKFDMPRTAEIRKNFTDAETVKHKSVKP